MEPVRDAPPVAPDLGKLVLAIGVLALVGALILAFTGKAWGFAFFGLFPFVWRGGGRADPRARLPEPEGRPLPAPRSVEEDWTPPARRDDEVDAPLSSPSPVAPPTPGPSGARPRGSSDLPASVAELGDEARRVAVRLARHGRGRLADAIEEALAEVARLARLRDELGDVQAAVEAARAEAERFDARAAAVEDPAARTEWATSARLARRRVEKLVELRAVTERAAARIESFRQVVKSAALDAARLDLAGTGDASLGELAASARGVEEEVEALHQTVEELRRLEVQAREGAP